DAYHRFLRAGAWSLAALFEVLARAVVASLCRDGALAVDIDDTLFNKSGTKVAGAGNFRDPIRSTGGKVVYALGLNLVVATLRITPPWGGEPLGLPVNMRLYRKGGRSHSEGMDDGDPDPAGQASRAASALPPGAVVRPAARASGPAGHRAGSRGGSARRFLIQHRPRLRPRIGRRALRRALVNRGHL